MLLEPCLPAAIVLLNRSVCVGVREQQSQLCSKIAESYSRLAIDLGSRSFLANSLLVLSF